MTTQSHNEPQHGFSTRAVHGRVEKRRTHPYHALQTPIVQTATYTFEDSADLCAFQDAKLWGGAPDGRAEYARFGNPTVQEVERRIAALENGEAALLLPDRHGGDHQSIADRFADGRTHHPHRRLLSADTDVLRDVFEAVGD